MDPLVYDIIAGAGTRVVTQAAYEATRPFWINPGTNVIFGKSPASMAAIFAGAGETVPVRLNPDYAGHAPPAIIVMDSLRVLVDGSLAPVNVDYGTDSLGNNWQWQCDVGLYANGTTLPALVGLFQQELVYWTGNDAADRVIPTSFPLDTGTVVVTTFVNTVGPASCMRYSGMTGSIVLGSSSLQTPGMIGTFTAAGFHISNQSFIGQSLNQSGRGYMAVVWRDANASPTHLAIGSYVGSGSHPAQIEVTTGSRAIGSNTLSAYDVGGLIQGTGLHIDLWNSPTSARMDGIWTGASGFSLATIVGADTLINVSLQTVTHVWIYGGSGVYRSTDFSGDSSVVLAAVGIGNQVTNLVKGVGSGGFVIGNSNEISSPGRTFYWVALDVSRSILTDGNFWSYKMTGTSTDPDRVSRLGKPVGWGSAERYLTAGAVASQGMRFKSGSSILHTGTQSTTFDGGFVASGGVVALGSAGYVDVGSGIASAGDDVYGYAMVDSFTESGPRDTGLPISCLANGEVGQYYIGQFVVTGATSTVGYYLTFGSLPPGLILNTLTGQVLGTPTTAGTYSYEVQVIDATHVSTKVCTMVIAPSSGGGGGGPLPPPPVDTPGTCQSGILP